MAKYFSLFSFRRSNSFPNNQPQLDRALHVAIKHKKSDQQTVPSVSRFQRNGLLLGLESYVANTDKWSDANTRSSNQISGPERTVYGINQLQCREKVFDPDVFVCISS